MLGFQRSLNFEFSDFTVPVKLLSFGMWPRALWHVSTRPRWRRSHQVSPKRVHLPMKQSHRSPEN